MTSGRHGWQLEGTSAELYERLLVPSVTRLWARDLIERAGLRPGARVLDVACGTGVLARLVASEVGERGRVAALDVNRGMLTVGRSLPPPDGAAIEWHEASADALPFGDGEFDTVLCQLGLQFFPDRPAALREARRVLVEGGTFGASVFTSIERNPAAHALAEALDMRIGGDASRAKRSEHSLADPDELHGLLDDAGFVHIRIGSVTKTLQFASVDEWVDIQLAATPLAALVADERMVERVRTDVGGALRAFTRDGAFGFPQEVHVALAKQA